MSARFQVTDRPKHDQWWIWDMEHKPLPKIIMRCSSRADANNRADALNQEQACFWCSHVLTTDQERHDGICDECTVNPMCPICHEQDSLHIRDEYGDVVCRDAAILALHPGMPESMRAKLARGETVTPDDVYG